MKTINSLPPKFQGLAYRQEFTKRKALSILKGYRGAKKYFHVSKDTKPTWWYGKKWKQTYTIGIK